MLEIEVKYPAPDLSGLEVRLRDLGAHRIEDRDDADHYFNAPDRDFRQTDEAFRIRRIGTRNILTYKGPKHQGPTKTRLEIEVPLADGNSPAADLVNLLTHLGYRSVAVVKKQRTIYQLDRSGFDVHISLDRVDRVGSYVEVEVVADVSRATIAKEVVLQLAGELGLPGTDERRSYLQLLIENTGETVPETTSPTGGTRH